MLPSCDVFVCCGEASGDAYGAAIVERLHEIRPDLVIAAMGGSALNAAGAEIEQGIDGLAVMGVIPVLMRLPEFIALGRRVARIIRERQPKVIITIDYPGFNLRLLRRLADMRQQGTRFIHVVAPQVWAWKPRRAKRIAQTVDELLCFFPFEPPLFNRFHAAKATCVGHPLVDLIPTGMDCRSVAQELQLQPDDRLLLLAPGSRDKEIELLLPIFDEAWELAQPRLSALGGRVVAAIAATPDVPRSHYRAHSDLPLIEGRYRELCARAQVGLITSGTATLEAGIIGLPHVLAYKTDRVTGRLARHVLLVDHIGLPNLVHNLRVVPELVQEELTPQRLAAHLVRLWDGPQRTMCREILSTTAERLGGGGAMQRIAEHVLAALGPARSRNHSDH